MSVSELGSLHPHENGDPHQRSVSELGSLHPHENALVSGKNFQRQFHPTRLPGLDPGSSQEVYSMISKESKAEHHVQNMHLSSKHETNVSTYGLDSVFQRKDEKGETYKTQHHNDTLLHTVYRTLVLDTGSGDIY